MARCFTRSLDNFDSKAARSESQSLPTCEGPEHKLDFSIESMLIGIMVSSFGLAYFTYGRKQQRLTPLISGLLMMILPFLVTNLVMLVSVTVLLCLAPWVVQKLGY
jgi:hypothetical protein